MDGEEFVALCSQCGKPLDKCMRMPGCKESERLNVPNDTNHGGEIVSGESDGVKKKRNRPPRKRNKLKPDGTRRPTRRGKGLCAPNKFMKEQSLCKRFQRGICSLESGHKMSHSRTSLLHACSLCLLNHRGLDSSHGARFCSKRTPYDKDPNPPPPGDENYLHPPSQGTSQNCQKLIQEKNISGRRAPELSTLESDKYSGAEKTTTSTIKKESKCIPKRVLFLHAEFTLVNDTVELSEVGCYVPSSSAQPEKSFFLALRREDPITDLYSLIRFFASLKMTCEELYLFCHDDAMDKFVSFFKRFGLHEHLCNHVDGAGKFASLWFQARGVTQDKKVLPSLDQIIVEITGNPSNSTNTKEMASDLFKIVKEIAKTHKVAVMNLMKRWKHKKRYSCFAALRTNLFHTQYAPLLLKVKDLPKNVTSVHLQPNDMFARHLKLLDGFSTKLDVFTVDGSDYIIPILSMKNNTKRGDAMTHEECIPLQKNILLGKCESDDHLKNDPLAKEASGLACILNIFVLEKKNERSAVYAVPGISENPILLCVCFTISELQVGKLRRGDMVVFTKTFKDIIPLTNPICVTEVKGTMGWAKMVVLAGSSGVILKTNDLIGEGILLRSSCDLKSTFKEILETENLACMYWNNIK